ncbi:MAG TPA: energy transducer TonB, partial [Thermoanaerobaculia bacterium]|nr:energy transducer TonB [Thermoanaerobaculia bacterium]
LACALFLLQTWHPLYIYPPPRSAAAEEPMRNPDVFPRVIKRVAPEYTDVARKGRIGGIVILELIVEKNGRARAARVLKPLPFGLDQKAIEAIRKWRFAPAKYRGRPVAAFYKVAIAFNPD